MRKLVNKGSIASMRKLVNSGLIADLMPAAHWIRKKWPSTLPSRQIPWTRRFGGKFQMNCRAEFYYSRRPTSESGEDSSHTTVDSKKPANNAAGGDKEWEILFKSESTMEAEVDGMFQRGQSTTQSDASQPLGNQKSNSTGYLNFKWNSSKRPNKRAIMGEAVGKVAAFIFIKGLSAIKTAVYPWELPEEDDATTED